MQTVKQGKSFVIEKKLPGCTVYTVGQQPRVKTNGLDAALLAADEYIYSAGGLLEKRCVLMPPSHNLERGYQTIGTCNYQNPVYAEGTVLPERGSSAFLQTADCPAIVFVNTQTNEQLLTHAGRWALSPRIDHVGEIFNIVVIAWNIINGGTDPRHIHVYITGAICPECFWHKDAKGQKLITPFLDTFGADIFLGDPKDGKLDMVKLITHQLVGFGVLEKNISHDGVCTFEAPGLTSHRLDGDERETANSILLIKQQ